MKLLIMVLCLCPLSVYSQINKATITEGNPDGSYSFYKATTTAYNYNTKAEVFTHVFNDTTSLKELEGLPYPPQPVFLSAYIQNGVLTFCRLWNDHKDYSVQGDGLLVPVKLSDGKFSSAESSGDTPEKLGLVSQSYHMSPVYKLDLDGNTATFTFTEPYGNSMYGFPLEGKFVITLVRDEPK